MFSLGKTTPGLLGCIWNRVWQMPYFFQQAHNLCDEIMVVHSLDGSIRIRTLDPEWQILVAEPVTYP